MTDPLRGSLAIAVATCRELVRQPAYAALVILTLVAYSLAPQLASFALPSFAAMARSVQLRVTIPHQG